jgi:hypothetical protein
MRIALRTGGGRGVYELAGSQGTCRASDLFQKELYYELTPDLVIPGRARADRRQGKPRIKLDEQKKNYAPLSPSLRTSSATQTKKGIQNYTGGRAGQLRVLLYYSNQDRR